MENETKLKMRRLIVDPTRPPEAVHHFVWARSGNEFLLEVGYVDLMETHQKSTAALKGEAVEPVDLIVVHRFSLSLDTAQRLADTVAQMMASLQEKEQNNVSAG